MAPRWRPTFLASGMKVRAWNRSREKAEPLEKDGAEIADSPGDAARSADFLLTVLADTDAVEEAVGEMFSLSWPKRACGCR